MATNQEKPAAIQCIEMANKIQQLTTAEQLLGFGQGKNVTIVLAMGQQQVQLVMPLDELAVAIDNWLVGEARNMPAELQIESFLEQVRNETTKMVAILNQPRTPN